MQRMNSCAKVAAQFAALLSSSGSESGSLRLQLSDSLQRISQLESENTSAHSTIHSLHSDSSARISSHLDVSNELILLRSTLEQSKLRHATEQTAYQRDREECVWNVNRMKMEKKKIQTELEREQRAMEEAKIQLTAARRAADRDEEEARRKETALKEKSAQIASSNARIDTLENELQKTTLALTAAEARHAAVKLSVAVLEQQSSTGAEALETLRNQVASHDSEVARWKEQNDTATRRWEGQFAAEQQKVSDLRAQLADAQLHASNAAQIAALETDLLRKQLLASERAHAEAAELASNAQQELSMSTAAASARARQLMQLEGDRASSLSELSLLQESHSSLRLELKDLRAKYKSIKHAYAALQSVAKANDAAEDRRTAMETKHTEAQRQLQSERVEAEAQRNRADALEKELSAAVERAADASELRAQAKELRERLKSTEADVAESRSRLIALQRSGALSAGGGIAGGPSASAAAEGLLSEQLESLRTVHGLLKVDHARLKAELDRVKTESAVTLRNTIRRNTRQQQEGPLQPLFPHVASVAAPAHLTGANAEAVLTALNSAPQDGATVVSLPLLAHSASTDSVSTDEEAPEQTLTLRSPVSVRRRATDNSTAIAPPAIEASGPSEMAE